MSLDSVLTQAAASVPECLAAGYVDAASGMLLSIRTVDSHPREVIDLVAAATADLGGFKPEVQHPWIQRMRVEC